MVAAAEGLITALHGTGGSMKNVNLIAEQAIAQEPALAQIKSAASQFVLDDSGDSRRRPFFMDRVRLPFSPGAPLKAADRDDVAISARFSLPEAAVHGVIRWLSA